MRIVQVNVIYGHGSTGRIVETLHKEYLKLGHESFVLFGRGKKPADSRVKRTGFLWEAKLWRFIQLFTGNSLGGTPLSTLNLKRHITKLKPDVVHLHCINGNACNVYSLLKWLRRKNFKTILTHHGSFMFTGGCGLAPCEGNESRCQLCQYRQYFINAASYRKAAKNYERMSTLHINEEWIQHVFVSDWLKTVATKSDFMNGDNIQTVFNPVDISTFSFSGESHGANRPFIFFPFSEQSIGTKGGQFAFELATRLKAKDLSLVTTGPGTENTIGLGYVSDPKEMARVYRGAQATVLMSSVESFSMPTIESILCGTPVVGFECGGPSTLKTNGMATFVPYGHLDALVEAIKHAKHSDPGALADVYSPETISKEYLEVYRSFEPDK